MMNIGILLAPVVLIGLVLYVAWPLLKESLADDSGAVDIQSELEVAREQKENLVASLKDIEMDYHTGKLSVEDYEKLRAEFEARALAAIEKVESLEKPKKKKPAKSRA